MVTVLVGISTWAGLDQWQTRHLQAIFQARLKEVVGEKADINRLVFDQHIRMHQQAVNLLASQRNLLDYLEQHHVLEPGHATPHRTDADMGSSEGASGNQTNHRAVKMPLSTTNHKAEQGHKAEQEGHKAERSVQDVHDRPYTQILFHREPPAWLPRHSVLRSMVSLRYVLLMTPHGRVREIFQGQPEPPPPDLLEPSPLLRQLSHSQAFVTDVDGTLFLLTSEMVLGRDNKPKALLMLANPLDDIFLASPQGLGGKYVGVVALLEGREPYVLASNKPHLTPSGASLQQLMGSYRVAGQSFFDYGASDLRLQLMTLVSKESFNSLTQSILQAERYQRAVSASILILVCLLTILWITHAIKQVTREIINFSRNILGSQLPESHTRDELSILRERFQHLTREIVQTRDSLHAELEERKRAEIEVRKLSYAVEQSPAAIMICDLTGKITYVNRQFARLTGYTAEEVLGRNPRFLQSGETPVATYQALWKTISSGDIWHGKLHNRRKDGSTYWERNTISHLHVPGQHDTLYLALKEDISPRIAMEKALKQAREAAETANLVKNDFLSNISHELRTPINIITGCTSLLRDQEFGKINKTQENYLKNISGSAERLARLISDLLDLSKVNSEQFILEKRFFNLPELVKSTSGIIMEQAKEKDLHFSCQVGANVPETVKGDPARLRQILLHVLRNAIKFTPTGQVKLVLACCDDGDHESKSVCFTVTDTGIGIPDEKQESIFDPFIQADTSSTRRYDGTGLGLTISKNLIELMGGTIRLKSKVNEGSVFSITIPFSLPTTAVHVDVSTPLPSGMKAAIIGKSPVNRLILKKLLISFGLEVEEYGHCQSPGELREKAGDRMWDFICLECASTPPAGLEEIAMIRADAALAELPVILFSNLSKAYREEAEQVPGVYCLNRPIQRTQLCRTVRKAISRKL